MAIDTVTLAIDGGAPVRRTMLPYARHAVDDADIEAVVAVLRSDWLTTGPAVAAFEAAFAERVGARFAVAVSSGTAALHAAVYAAGLGPGDEAIVPPLTFVATANCVRYQGAAVRFADVRRDTLNLDSAQIERARAPRTKAIISVDYAGQPADMDELCALAREHDLVVIEDASHALGAIYRTRRVGSLAHMTTFSLHPAKHVTTGEGGVITTDDPDLAARLRLFRTHGITSDHHQRQREGSWLYEMVELGFNYRISDMQCALGQSQLAKLDAWLDRRSEIAARYSAAFGTVPEVETPTTQPDRESAWHLYVLRLNLDALRVDRARVFEALRAENIGVNVHYIPVPWHPYYERLGYSRGNWPVSEHEYTRLLSLPIFPAMSDRDVDDVIEATIKVVRYFSR